MPEHTHESRQKYVAGCPGCRAAARERDQRPERKAYNAQRQRAYRETADGRRSSVEGVTRYQRTEAGQLAARRAKWRAQGIDPDAAEQALRASGGVCGLCDGPPTGRGRLHVDHDHDTGRVRGVLCSKCNHGLGLLGDTVEALHRAINYLEKN